MLKYTVVLMYVSKTVNIIFGYNYLYLLMLLLQLLKQ